MGNGVPFPRPQTATPSLQVLEAGGQCGSDSPGDAGCLPHRHPDGRAATSPVRAGENTHAFCPQLTSSVVWLGCRRKDEEKLRRCPRKVVPNLLEPHTSRARTATVAGRGPRGPARSRPCLMHSVNPQAPLCSLTPSQASGSALGPAKSSPHPTPPHEQWLRRCPGWETHVPSVYEWP